VAGFGEPLHLLLKTTVDPHTLVSSVVRAVRAIDPNVVVSPAGSLGDFLDDEFRAPAFEFRTLGAFGGIGLILAGVGIFSVMAYTVSLQRHSIGVRMALGAAPRDILRMVLKNGIVLIVSGVAIGALASIVLTQFMARLLWGVSARDPWTFAAATAAMVTIGSAACFLPARRAAAVDPLVMLRTE
jgi:putative ABC transport system permease protein